MKIEFNDITWFGRTLDHNKIRYFDYSASGFCFILKGKKAEAVILSDPENWSDTNKGVIGVYVTEGTDASWKTLPSEPDKKFVLLEKENKITLFESDTEKTVVIRVIKISEAAFGFAGLKELSAEGTVSKPELKSDLKIEIIGDSITCGYGIEGVWNKDAFTTLQQRADKSYGFLTAKNLNAELHCCSWSGIGIISNYVDPATAKLPDVHWLMPALWPYTDKSLSLRLKTEPEVWDGSKYVPDIVVIHLGTNDASWVQKNEDRRLAYVSGLRQLIEAVHRRTPSAKICCCLGIMGQDLCPSVSEAVNLFKNDFPAVQIKAVEFPVQNEADGIAADWHPSAVTHEKSASLLAEQLKNW